MTFASSLLFAAVTVGTWNGEWFPSGRAEHRAAPEIEEATVQAAGRMLREGLAKADPEGTNGVIICLNEMRGPKVVERLCTAIGRTNLTVAIISGYRRRDRFDQQQDAIITTLPVTEAHWSKWKNAKQDTPPRGYAFAKIVISPAVTANVYSVHLKSNYGQTTDELARRNAAKRLNAIAQIAESEKDRRGKRQSVIVAGDFNADKWSKRFSLDRLFTVLEEAGFMNTLELMPSSLRITYPGRGKWGNSALDYIMLKSLEPCGPPFTVSAEGISDHDPVFVNIESGGL